MTKTQKKGKKSKQEVISGDDMDVDSSFETEIIRIFNASQTSGSIHQKLAVELRKYQELGRKDFGVGKVGEHEDYFLDEFIELLNVVLSIKKKTEAADRIIKFVLTFIRYGFNRESLMLHLMKGFEAKEKMVRLRCCQLVSMLIVLLKEIDEEIYEVLIEILEKRLLDKESKVRGNAAVALCRLVIGLEHEENQTVVKLCRLTRYEQSAEVRRVVMLALEPSEVTIPYLLERSRDVDKTNRKYLFSKIMSKIDYKTLSIEKREDLLMAGIRDRDAAVRQACIEMVAGCWLKSAGNDLAKLFEGLDVVDSEIADETVKCLLRAFPEIAELIEFSGNIWQELKPESAFLLRHTLEFFKERKEFAKLDERIPEVLDIVRCINKQLEIRSNEDRDNMDEGEPNFDEADAEVDYIILQLLLVAKLSDFMDELGRREMLTLMRRLLLIPDISEVHIGHIVDIIKRLSVDETDFTQIIVEVISEVQQSGEEAVLVLGEEDKKSVELLTQLKGLYIIRALLERCYKTLTESSVVYALTQEYVSPALTQHEPALLKCGIDCLALCALLDKQMAVGNAELLIAVCNQGTEELQIHGLKALFDLCFVYGVEVVGSNLEPGEIISIFMDGLASESYEIQGISAEGLCKLLYARKISEADLVLKNLCILYFHPEKADNSKFLQCLSYFFPAFCYSSSLNQQRMAGLVVDILVEYTRAYNDLKSVNPSIKTPYEVALQLLSWIDPKISKDILSSLNINVQNIEGFFDISWYFQIGTDALVAANSSLEDYQVLKTMIQLVTKLVVDSLKYEELVFADSVNVNIVMREQYKAKKELELKKISVLINHVKNKMINDDGDNYADLSILVKLMAKVEGVVLKQLGLVTLKDEKLAEFLHLHPVKLAYSKVDPDFEFSVDADADSSTNAQNKFFDSDDFPATPASSVDTSDITSQVKLINDLTTSLEKPKDPHFKNINLAPENDEALYSSDS
ncbi:Condensin complex subunit 3 [Zancudomyces culisetae]|uniref:Condensin complex subunit 3 n=1 Tax=Zancudomyces culisetae TaxID=1213189 RepID=A0A1R1PXC7_ZANCU|nr:Condensin complex subunit 3 [Zancudomyces culisetae]|eukprot:OMH85567.1 Condensin complex subunit 3 [Zancudomyces culisetae]